MSENKKKFVVTESEPYGENDIYVHKETNEEYLFKGYDDSFPKKYSKIFLQKLDEKEIKSHEERFFKRKN